MPSPLQADCLTILPGIRHGFFTRAGGVSSGIYKTLNCGLGSDDDPVAVIENRARVARHIGASSDDVVTLFQTHSATALIVDGLAPRDRLPKADAVITRTPGLAIGVLTADCTPILLADPQARVVAAAHAGWRGAMTGIVEATVAAMERLGARRDRIRAAVGPSINQTAYEVGPEFEAALLTADKANVRYFRRPGGGHAHFDLPGYVAGNLAASGIPFIDRQNPCTYRNESLFFSFRRSNHANDPDYGRQISAIVVT